jgi:hypothetical protein
MATCAPGSYDLDFPLAPKKDIAIRAEWDGTKVTSIRVEGDKKDENIKKFLGDMTDFPKESNALKRDDFQCTEQDTILLQVDVKETLVGIGTSKWLKRDPWGGDLKLGTTTAISGERTEVSKEKEESGPQCPSKFTVIHILLKFCRIHLGIATDVPLPVHEGESSEI